MELDGHTLTVSSLAVRLCFALVFAAAWLRNRRDRYLFDWGLGVVLASAGFVGALTYPYGEYFSARDGFLIYTLVGAAFGYTWQGVARFDGRPLPAAAPLLVALTPGVIYSGLLLSGQPAAIGFAGAFVGFSVGALLLVVQLLRAPPGSRLPSRYIAAAAALVYVAIFLASARMSVAEVVLPPEGTVTSDVLALAVDQLCGILLYVALLSLAGERARAHLEGRVSRDLLTGVLNRAGLFAAAEALVAARPRSNPVAVILVDLDRFKAINDRHGHETGDAVLVEFARRADALVHARGGILARWGGEEFVALLPTTTVPAAAALAEEIRRAVASGPFPRLDPAERVTVSIGVAAVASGEPQVDPAIARADSALYAAKRAGRDRVVA